MVLSQGRRGQGGRGAMAHPRIQIVGFFGNFRFRRKITDFGLALSTFDQFRFFCISSVLSSVLYQSVAKLRRSCTRKGHLVQDIADLNRDVLAYI